ncbi:unnamed protein product [Sympodiomycopsis kandeliae]
MPLWLSKRWPTGADNSKPLPRRSCFFCNEPSIVLPISLAQDIYKGGIDGDESINADERESATSSKRNSVTQSISLGTPSDWKCAHCGCRNLSAEDEPRGIATWEDSMAGGQTSAEDGGIRDNLAQLSSSRSLTRISSSTIPSSVPASPSSKRLNGTDSDDEKIDVVSAPTTPFCRRCATNQQIQLTLLAEFDPTTNHASSSNLSSSPSLAAYRADLDRRYPVICDQCRPSVEAEIEHRNGLARRDIWRDRMEKNKIAANRSASTHSVETRWMPNIEASKTSQDHQDVIAARIRSRLMKFVHALCIWASYWLCILRTIAFLDLDHQTTESKPQRTLSISSITLLVFNGILLGVTFWNIESSGSQVDDEDLDEILDADWDNPQGDSQRKSGTSNDDAKAELRIAHVVTIFALVTLEVFLLNATRSDPTPFIKTLLPDLLQRSRVMKTVGSACMVIQSICSVVVTLVALDRGANRVLPLQQVARDQHHQPQPTGAHQGTDATVANETGAMGLDGMAREIDSAPTAMDWQPTIGDDADYHTNSATGLGPQKFYAPEAPTGLEGLLDRNLNLDDNKSTHYLLQPPASPREGRLWFTVGLLSGWVIALGVVLGLFMYHGGGLRVTSTGDGVTGSVKALTSKVIDEARQRL